MIRTQVYLPEELKRELEIVAKTEQKPVAEIVRRAVKREVSRRRKQNAGYTLGKIAAMAVKGGPGDLSANLFDYLYGEKSDYSRENTLKRARWYESYVKKQKTQRAKSAK